MTFILLLQMRKMKHRELMSHASKSWSQNLNLQTLLGEGLLVVCPGTRALGSFDKALCLLV